MIPANPVISKTSFTDGFTFVNTREPPVLLTCLSEGNWQVLADGENTFRWKETLYAEEKIQIPPQSALLLGR